MTIPWLPLGARRPDALNDARLVLHHAALVLGSAAHSLIEHEPHDAHTSLGFDARSGTLFTKPLGGNAEAPELHLVVETLKLELRGADDEVIAYHPLPGQTMSQALGWLQQRARASWSPDAKVVRREFEDAPDHPIGQGCAFDPPDTAAHAELARWFANGMNALDSLRDPWSSMTSPRAWPEPFELRSSVLLSRVEAGNSEDERTVHAGMSPGDEFFAQPYFYCSPYPRIEPPEDLPDLPHGHWQKTPFFAAVLTAEELFEAGDDQESTALAWLRKAMDACAGFLGERRR